MLESKEETVSLRKTVEFTDQDRYDDFDTENNVDADVEKEIPLEEPDQEILKLQVTKISVRNLRNVEIHSDGKNDPWVEVRVGTWHHQSTIMEGAGRNATWRYAEDNPSMMIEFSKDRLSKEMLEIQVFDKNLTSKDVLIGNGTHSFDPLIKLQSRQDAIDMVIPLFDEDGYEAGEALLTFIPWKLNHKNQSHVLQHQMENPNEFMLPSKRVSLPEVVIEKQESHRISLVQSDDDFKDYLDTLSDDDNGSYEDDFG